MVFIVPTGSQTNTPLLRPQRVHRLDARRPPRRHKSRYRGACREHQDGKRQAQRIVGLNSIKLGRHEASSQQRHRNFNRQPDRDLQYRAPHHQRKDMRVFGDQGSPYVASRARPWLEKTVRPWTPVPGIGQTGPEKNPGPAPPLLKLNPSGSHLNIDRAGHRADFHIQNHSRPLGRDFLPCYTSGVWPAGGSATPVPIDSTVYAHPRRWAREGNSSWLLTINTTTSKS